MFKSKPIYPSYILLTAFISVILVACNINENESDKNNIEKNSTDIEETNKNEEIKNSNTEDIVYPYLILNNEEENEKGYDEKKNNTLEELLLIKRPKDIITENLKDLRGKLSSVEEIILMEANDFTQFLLLVEIGKLPIDGNLIEELSIISLKSREEHTIQVRRASRKTVGFNYHPILILHKPTDTIYKIDGDIASLNLSIDNLNKYLEELTLTEFEEMIKDYHYTNPR